MSEQTGPAHRDLGDRGSGCRAQAGRGLQACAAGVPTCRGPDLVDAKEQTHLRDRLLSKARPLEKNADVRAGPRFPVAGD